MKFAFLLLFISVSASAENFVSVCDRESHVQANIASLFDHRDCSSISANDLEKLDGVYIRLGRQETQDIHIRKSDLSGLKNVTALQIYGSSKAAVVFENDVFSDLKKLNVIATWHVEIKGLPDLKSVLSHLENLTWVQLVGGKVDIESLLQGPPKIDRLVIDHAETQKLTKKMFEICLVSEISLLSSVESIEPGAFESCKKLGVLDVRGNSIVKFDPLTLNGLTDLFMLNISSDFTVEYPVGMLEPTPNLTSIILGGPKFQKIPDGFFENLKTVPSIFFSDHAPLSRTTKAAFRGIPLPTDLPATFGVDVEGAEGWGMK
jgi:hypothetical protein